MVLVMAAMSCSFYVACGDDDVIFPTGGTGGQADGGGGTGGSGGRAGSGGTGGVAGSGGTGGVAGTGGSGGGSVEEPDGGVDGGVDGGGSTSD